MPHFIRSFYPVCLIAMSSAILGCNDPEFRLPDTSDAGVDANADMMDVEDLSDMHIEDMTEDLGIIVDSSPDMIESDMADMQADADMLPDEDMDMAPDMMEDMSSTDLPSTCGESCQQQDLTLMFGQNSRTIERAVYGLSSPDMSVNGQWEIYIEALQGGFSGCPDEQSSAPDYTMVLTGMPIFTQKGDWTSDSHNINAVLFDYEGDLLPDPPFYARATAVQVSPRALDVCVPCVENSMSDEDGFVALDMSATFMEGTISGSLYAVHCDSLDAK